MDNIWEPKKDDPEEKPEAFCDVCFRPVSELKPFGGLGEPWGTDKYKGQKLLKITEDIEGQIGSMWICEDCLLKSYDEKCEDDYPTLGSPFVKDRD